MDKFYLPPPAEPRSQKSFFKVLGARASRRRFKQIADEKLADFLWYSAKALTMSQGPDAIFCQHRYVPSAGGIHPIDLLIISPVERTVSLYDPVAHALCLLDISDDRLNAFLTYTEAVLNPESGVMIWYAARPEKVSAKYQNEISLIWRDAGALIASMYLIAEALRLNCCALGVLGNNELRALTDNSSILGVGGCIIGSR
ncbi:nitroreductase family protein [Hymenobacter coalescens]